MKNHNAKSLLTACTLLLGSYGFGQNIENASFENWIDSCATNQAPIGWQALDTISGPDQRGPDCIGNINAFDGVNFMTLKWSAGIGSDTNSEVGVEISDLVPGESYAISFYTVPDDYWIYSQDVFFMYFKDGVNIGNCQPIPFSSEWQELSFYFTATDTSHLISFQVTDGGGQCGVAALGLDKMTISQVSGISEFNTENKTIVRTLDIMGNEIEIKPNTILIHEYSDGSTSKEFRIE